MNADPYLNYEYLWPECDTCEGTGDVLNDYDVEVTCPDCAGMGYIAPEPEGDE